MKIIFNGEEIKFDRTCACDFCGDVKTVGVTHYGTTHYNRLICEDCVNEITNYHKTTFSEIILRKEDK